MLVSMLKLYGGKPNPWVCSCHEMNSKSNRFQSQLLVLTEDRVDMMVIPEPLSVTSAIWCN
jgi:hypothetical protein